jgi:hypothetical protein
VSGPEDKTLVLTVPKMEMFDALVPSTTGDDEEMLKDYAAIHLNSTGFPWESGANTYIAGHRLGYPNTPSFLAFYDLDKLEKGDEVFVADADGGVYTYEKDLRGPDRSLRHRAGSWEGHRDAPDVHAAGLLPAPGRAGREGGLAAMKKPLGHLLKGI